MVDKVRFVMWVDESVDTQDATHSLVLILQRKADVRTLDFLKYKTEGCRYFVHPSPNAAEE